MTPEQYKQLAKFAGHEAEIGEHAGRTATVLITRFRGLPNYELYTPDANGAQAFQLMDEIWKKSLTGELSLWDVLGDINDRVWRDKLTLRQATCHAVLALENQE